MGGPTTSDQGQPWTLGPRLVGGGLAAALTGGLAAVGLLAGGSSGAGLLGGSVSGWLLFLGTYGCPVGILVGSWFGPRAARASSRAIPGLATRVAIVAVGLGALEVSALSALRDTLNGAQPVTSLPAQLVFLPLIGLSVLGLPAFVLTLPATLAWAVLARTFSRRLAPAAAHDVAS